RRGLLRRAPPRRGARAPARPGGGARADRWDPPGRAVAAAGDRRRADGDRSGRAPPRRLALGAHASGRDHRQGLSRRRHAPAPLGGRAAAGGGEPRARAEPAGPAAGIRAPGRRAARDRSRPGAPERVPPRRAARRLMPESPPVEWRELTKRYGDTVAVEALSFSVPAGRITGFLGPNGAGKSTTLRMILGLVHPRCGEALRDVARYVSLTDPARAVGAVLETDIFHPGRSGRNHLRVLTTAAGVPRSRVDEVLAEVELTGAAGRHVSKYSLGMRQRLSVAAALLGPPRAPRRHQAAEPRSRH